MRLKITTSPPLPPLQAWYFLPDSALRPSTLRLEEGEPCTTVESLKQRLCSELKTLRDARISKENVALLLDGFELLDSSSADVLRDGDLLWYGPIRFPYILYTVINLVHEASSR